MSRYLINRDYARLWYGQALSTLGDYIFDTTLVVWVATVLLKHSRWGPIAVSGLMLSMLIAVMFVGPIAGVFVDRWSRRRTMLRSEVIRGSLVGALTVVTLLPRHTLPTWLWLALLYLVVFAVNATGQFFGPARFATIGDIVPGEVDQTKAFGIGQATASTAAIIGPPLAAPLLFAVGIQWALALNAVSYAVSYFAVRSVQFPASDSKPAADPTADRPAWRTEFIAGLRMFAGNRFLVAILTLAVIAQLGTGAMNALDVYFVTDNLHVSAHLFGVMSMALGIGSVVGAALAGRIVKAINARNATWLGTLLAGILIIVYARQSSFVFGVVAVFLFAVPVAVLNTSIGPLLLAATPREFLGRMMGVFNPINMGASTISVIVAGTLASTAMRNFHATVAGVHFGRIDTIFAVSGLLIAVAGGYAFFALPPSAASTGSPDVPPIPAQANPLEPISVVEPAVDAAVEEA
jgi:MFS family permease